MEDKADMSFWEHLDVLRGTLIKIIAGTAICGIMAFILKDEVFSIILAPKDSSFITYRLLDKISASASGTTADAFSVDIINTGLAGQVRHAHEDSRMHRHAAHIAVCHISAVRLPFARPLCQRAEILVAHRHKRIRHVRHRDAHRIFPHLPAHIPVLGHISGEQRNPQHDYTAVVHQHLDYDVHHARHTV